jgi:hypothetical protein
MAISTPTIDALVKEIARQDELKGLAELALQELQRQERAFQLQKAERKRKELVRRAARAVSKEEKARRSETEWKVRGFELNDNEDSRYSPKTWWHLNVGVE